MNADPKISVIVPVYNAEKYLRQCVESVLAQNFFAWELILVDDGSPDKCGVICDELALSDHRIRVFHIPNSGVSEARNFGLSKARAPYVTFVDADDIIDKSMLRLMHAVAIKEDVDAVCLDFRKFTAIPKREIIHRKNTYVRVKAHTYVKTALYQRIGNASICGKLFSRKLLGNNPFPCGIRYEDLDTFYKILLQTDEIAYCPSCLYYYRSNPDSYINTFNLKRADVLDVTDRMAVFMRKNYPFLAKAADDRRLSAHFNILCLMAANKVYNKTLEDRCWRVIKELRRKSLLNSGVRLKNKIGIFVSFIGGKPLVKYLGKHIYG